MQSGENCEIYAKMLCKNKSKHFGISAATNSIRIQCNPKFILKRKAKFKNFLLRTVPEYWIYKSMNTVVNTK